MSAHSHFGGRIDCKSSDLRSIYIVGNNMSIFNHKHGGITTA